MVFTDDTAIKIDSVILPGLLKSIEVKGGAQVDEQEVEGAAKKPKQATGYEDTKINIELILEDDKEMSRLDKLTFIQQLFKKYGQEKPEIHQIVSMDTVSRGVSQVIFKSLSHKTENKKQQIIASLEFWEYTPITIAASKSVTSSASNAKKAAKTSDSATSELNLKAEYKSYLPERGTAPKLKKTPAQDNKASDTALAKARGMPY